MGRVFQRVERRPGAQARRWGLELASPDDAGEEGELPVFGWIALPKDFVEFYIRVFDGGCPKDRFLHTSAGEPGLHYLCEGYRRFFNHIAPVMKRHGRIEPSAAPR